MTPWLNICGAGLVYSLPHVAEHTVPSLPRVPVEGFAKPSLDVLPELLSAWRQKPCPPLRRIPLYARMGLLAALQALQQSSWQGGGEQGCEDMALVIGTAHSGIVMSMDFMDSILDAEPRLSSPTAFSHAVNNMGAGLLSLLLDIRGPSETLSQFELSFAGAVHTAYLLLHSGRVSRVLVGAMDEVDARFTQCCPSMTDTAQGAAFFCLEKADESTEKGRMCVSFGETTSIDIQQNASVLLSGVAKHDGGENLSPYYGQSMWTQALDVYLAVQSAGMYHCLCTDTQHGLSARIDVQGRG